MKQKESFFWTSYSDLMTSLFFIMLVLFVLVIVLLHKRMEATERELAEIKLVQKSTEDLSKQYFEYNPFYKKYVLKVHCFFEELHYDIEELPDDTKQQLGAAGVEIQKFLSKHNDNKYLLIIEGQASKNSEAWTDRNYDLSFERAYSLMKYWKDVCGINFGKNCEVQIAGSGDGRYNFGYTGGENTERFKQLDATLMRERGSKEVDNQRFVIHIIPKNIIEDAEKKEN